MWLTPAALHGIRTAWCYWQKWILRADQTPAGLESASWQLPIGHHCQGTMQRAEAPHSGAFCRLKQIHLTHLSMLMTIETISDSMPLHATGGTAVLLRLPRKVELSWQDGCTRGGMQTADYLT